MSNKIMAVLLGLMFLITLVPMVLAEDTNANTNIDANITPIDEREVRSMLSPYGAEVRMLQLEKSVTRNVLIGDIVIKVITKNHADSNTIEAENTLDSMGMLLEEIKTTPVTGDKNMLVQKFVELKKEARTLSANFRKETQSLITSTDKSEIMTQVREIDKNELNEINKSIKEVVKNYNSKRMEEKFNSMGVNGQEMVMKIKNGDVNLKEVKEYAIKEFNDMNSAEKKRIAAKMKNDSIKKIIEQKEITQKMVKDLKQNLMNNIQKRAENLSEWIEKKAIDANLNGNADQAQRLINQNNRIKNMIDRMENRNGGMNQ